MTALLTSVDAGMHRTWTHLQPISLDELAATAALLTRVDRKYLLTPRELERVLDRLPADARALEIDGRRAIGYTSTYLDTPELGAFHAAAHGRRQRWKVRTRSYATGGSFLEVKTRRGGRTVKERTDWRGDVLDAAGRGFVDGSLAASGIALDGASLDATLVTAYRRSTLLLPRDNTRATVDADLTFHRPCGGPVLTLGERVILETKSGRAPSELDRILWRLGLRPRRLSKYAAGLAAQHPALPHNRWHRILPLVGA